MSGKENSLTETWLMIQKVRACCPPSPQPPLFLANAEKLFQSLFFFLEINISKSTWINRTRNAFCTAKQTVKCNKMMKLIFFPRLTLLHFRCCCTCGTWMSCTDLQHLTRVMAPGLFTFRPLEIQGFPHSSHLRTSFSLVVTGARTPVWRLLLFMLYYRASSQAPSAWQPVSITV